MRRQNPWPALDASAWQLRSAAAPQERLELADANRASQLAERRTKAAAFLARTQEAAARLQARTAAMAERSRAALADAQARPC